MSADEKQVNDADELDAEQESADTAAQPAADPTAPGGEGTLGEGGGK